MVRALAASGALAVLAGVLLAEPARAADYFVPGDFPTIQAALLAAADYDTIHVAAGTWTGPLDTRDLDIELRGEGAGVSILDALGAPVVLSAGLGDDVSIVHVIGFTITGGGDGVVTIAGGKVDLTQCEVRDNPGTGGRGHIDAHSCSFTGNGSHGLESFDALWDCTFEGNGGWGAQKLDAKFEGPPMQYCRFLGNGLGGARLVVSSPGPAWPPEIKLLNVTFVGDNLQVSALGEVGSTVLRQVTLLGGTVKLLQGALTVTDSILRSPTPITDLSPTGDVSVSWSDLPGTWLPGTGNIDADPLFTDEAGGDYTLLPGSPCINAGDPAVIADPDDSPADMGAFTFDPWTLLGLGPPGGPMLAGGGALIAGKPIGLKLFAVPQEVLWVVISTTELHVPFKGGVLWPAPDLVFPAVPLPFAFQIALGNWPAGLPAGQTFVTQVWWPEASAASGWISTNGLRGTQP